MNLGDGSGSLHAHDSNEHACTVGFHMQWVHGSDRLHTNELCASACPGGLRFSSGIRSGGLRADA